MNSYKAKIDVVLGNKKINQFLQAGNFQTQAGVKETWVITYKTEEAVTHARVRKLMEETKQKFNHQILSYGNIRIELVEEALTARKVSDEI